MTLTIIDTKPCGFCQTDRVNPETGAHDKCCIGIKMGKHAKYTGGVVWTCGCEICPKGRRRCAYCHNTTTEEIDPATWECFDIAACREKMEVKRANDPFLVQLRDIKEKVNMAKVQDNKAKAEKAEKVKEPTFCLVTGEPTKGGLFKPGMDARYVSERVTVVLNAGFTKKAADEQRAKMKKDGVSDALKGKFEKSLGIAQAKHEAKVAAKAEKDAAKAAKASEKASA